MKYLLILLSGFLVCSCASVQAPQGGPKDLTPPKLLASSPIQSATGFNGKTISLEFNEDVVENNPKQLFLSPFTQSTVTTGSKRLRIMPDSGFLPNTTYTLNLRKKIKDEKEGNLLRDTTILFSTGANTDTLMASISIQTPANKLLTGKSFASLVDEQNRKYFDIGDSARKLEITGLKPGRYYMEVFNDGNEDYKYEEEEGFLFFDSLRIDSNSIFRIKPLPHKFKPIKIFKQVRQDTLVLETTNPISLSGEILDILIFESSDKTNFRFFPFKKRYEIAYFDSTGNCLEDTLDRKLIDSTRSVNSLALTKKPTIQMGNKGLSINYLFNWQIDKMPNRFEVNQDSVWVAVKPTFSKRELTFTLPKFQVGKVRFRMDTISFFSKTGYRLDSLTIEKGDMEPTGEISGKIESEINQNVYVELLDGQSKLINKTKGKDFMFHVKPGKYFIQTFVDWNGDGRYTGGNKVLHRKGEPFYKYETAVDLKPGWDIEKLGIKPEF